MTKLTKYKTAFLVIFICWTVCLPIKAGFLLLQYEYQKAMREKKLMANQMLFLGEEFYKKGKWELSIPSIYYFVKFQGGWTISEEMMFMTESQRMEYWNTNKKPYEEYIPNLAHVTHADSLVAEAYNCALLSKGILLNLSAKTRQYVLDCQDSLLKDAYENYNEFNKKYQELLESKEDSLVDLYGYVVDSLKNVLIKKIPIDRMSILQNLQWTDIKNCLDPEEASIEFIKFPTLEGRILYAALVLRKDYDTPVMKELFYEDELALSNTYPYIDESFAYLKIWKDIMPYLNGVTNLYFSPVGLLHKIALEYLPDEQALPINWLFNMYRLSSTREILTARASQKKDVRTVLFGGLNYTMNSNTNNNVTSHNNNDEILTRSVRNIRKAINDNVTYLPGTLMEIQSIGESLKSRGCTYELISGDEGTEQCFRKLNGQPFDIIHIATHGFYLVNKKEDENGSRTKLSDEEQMMLCSGLFLAGANQGLSDTGLSSDNDGVLTANEVSQLDLTHTDLITLSACETALGEISGDGVFGLQRGFKKAGVQSQLVSLWPVNDEATSVFMTSFYKYYLTSNSKYRALRLAQQALCRVLGGKYNEPRFWGAFILIDGVDLTSDMVKKNQFYIDSIYKERLATIQKAKDIKRTQWELSSVRRYANRANSLYGKKLINDTQMDSLIYSLSISAYNNYEQYVRLLSETAKIANTNLSKLIDSVKNVNDIEKEQPKAMSQEKADAKAEKDLEDALCEIWKQRPNKYKKELPNTISDGMKQYGIK